MSPKKRRKRGGKGLRRKVPIERASHGTGEKD